MPSRCCMRTIGGFLGRERVDRASHAPDGVEGVELGREAHQRVVVGGDVVERARRPARLVAVDVDGDALARSSPATAAGSRSTSMRSAACHARTNVCCVASSARSCRPERSECDRVHEPSVLAIQRSHRGRLAASEGVEHVGIHRAHRSPARRRQPSVRCDTVDRAHAVGSGSRRAIGASRWGGPDRRRPAGSRLSADRSRGRRRRR